MAKTPATHYGECQVCSHTQKLPNGNMALHGYTKQWHFFAGVCPGSKHLPFEQSMDMIPPRIADAKAMAKRLRISANDTRLEKDFNTEFDVHAYDVKMDSWAWHAKYGKQRYVTVKGVLRGESEPRNMPGMDPYVRHTVFIDFVFQDKACTKKLETYDQTVEEIRDERKEREAKRIEALAAQYEDYVKWQTQRIKNWKVKPLKPVTD